VSNFIEFGPGKVLGSLIKRIGSTQMYRDRGVEVLNVTDLTSAKKVAEASVRGWTPAGSLTAY
jgi:malonyl CoA-acyl carrier protein transacylase